MGGASKETKKYFSFNINALFLFELHFSEKCGCLAWYGQFTAGLFPRHRPSLSASGLVAVGPLGRQLGQLAAGGGGGDH